MKIGRYKLIHEIGHGGMGVVYMAVQKEPVKRKVALKIIKPGMDTKEVVARFEAERQALAMMDHQSIATVLDGGSTESGRPYFVMELVEGTPIHEYCDACQYTTRQRLELFIQVCQAVQHAHLKGVIHRDIKPSNIMVTTYDTVAVPKVIDFGIAKAVHQQLTDGSVYTQVSQMIGTPLYMSPEQAERTGLDVDTRTDVYSLGVLLYELLTGTTPFDKGRFQESGLDEVKRIIREEAPPRPSTRLSTLGETDIDLDTLVDKHHTDLCTLTQELSGELDWIVMRAMEKDRNRRYESASDFSKDVQRYLDDEPVEACPPSTTYRLGKFCRRNKVALVTALAFALVLILSAGVAGWQAVVATEAMEREQELATIADEQRRQAETNYTKAREAVQQMLTRVADEELAKIPEMKEVRLRLLEDAVAFYTELLKLDPRDPLAYYERGSVYEMLARYKEVRAGYEKAIELAPDNANFHHGLGRFLFACPDVAFRDWKCALLHATWALRLDPENLTYHHDLAILYSRSEEEDKALAEMRKTAELSDSEAARMVFHAAASKIAGDMRGALEWEKKALALAPNDPGIHGHLADFHLTLEEYENAIAAETKYIALSRKVRSESADNGAFYPYVTRGDAYAALKMYREAIADCDKAVELGPFRSFTYKRRATAHFHLGNYAEALTDINKAVELNPTDTSAVTWISPSLWAQCPDESFRTGLLEVAEKAIELNNGAATAYATRGIVHVAFGRMEEASSDFDKAIEGGLSDRYLWYQLALARLRVDDVNGYRAACDQMLQRLGDTTVPKYAYWMAWTCLVAPHAVNDYGPVVRLAELAVEAKPDSEVYLKTLGGILYRAGRFEEAVQRLTEANDLIEDPESLSTSSSAYVWYFLAMAHHKLAHEAEAKQWLDRATEWTDKVLAEHDAGTSLLRWNRRLTLKRFREEADAMIGKDKE